MGVMNRLYIIQEDVRSRTEAVSSDYPNWPCRKGCDDCCRRLAVVPQVTQAEWELIAAALDTLPAETAELVRKRIRDAAGRSRPVVCPLLDLESGACLVYERRPVACRAYGFYVERNQVLGCGRIEGISSESADVVWGNYEAVQERLNGLGTAVGLHVWLDGG